MRLALQLAAKGQGRVEPNPMVGCVLVQDGICIGQGYHHAFGGPHAEVDALKSCADAADATAYVTLEPCCHQGKTPPCSLALIDAHVRRVVVAMRDPHAKVNGDGIGQLRDAGIDVTLGVLKHDAEELNAPYLKRLRTGLPWVIAKWAMTADGRTATVTGQSQWISGAESRKHVHRLRSRVDAIVVAMGTVISDDPMLNARLPAGGPGSDHPARLAKRIVLCRKRIPPIDSKLIRTADAIPTWIFASPLVETSELRSLEEAGAIIFRLDTDDAQQMVLQTLQQLGGIEMTNVMIEGGPKLLGSFLDSSSGRCLIDECHVYVGAKVFGGQSASGPIAGDGVGPIELAPTLSLHRVDRFDDDVRLIYRR